MTIQPLGPRAEVDLIDRAYLSQYAEAVFGVVVHSGGSPADADGHAVTALMRRSDGTPVFSRPAARMEPGRYGVQLAAADTAEPGYYDLEFTYSVQGQADRYVHHVEVGSSAPAYDALPPAFRASVESVWARLGDLYDSPFGGPHLQAYVQTRFGRNRVAQLLRLAVGRLNTIAQPHTSYGLDHDFPHARWGALLEQALWVEVVRHLRRSYLEQPDVLLGTAVSRLDRQGYYARWGEVLAEESADLERMLATFKIEHMGLGVVSVLVSGGAYGRYGPTVPGGAGQGAARGYHVFAHRVL